MIWNEMHLHWDGGSWRFKFEILTLKQRGVWPMELTSTSILHNQKIKRAIINRMIRHKAITLASSFSWSFSFRFSISWDYFSSFSRAQWIHINLHFTSTWNFHMDMISFVFAKSKKSVEAKSDDFCLFVDFVSSLIIFFQFPKTIEIRARPFIRFAFVTSIN